MPRSSRKARSWLITDVRRATETIAHAMDGLQVQLVVRLDRDEAHVMSVDSFRDGLGIEEIVLVRLYKGLYELGGDQLHVMALFSQNTSQEVSA